MNNHILKAVFPVAGLGTRFLPATKANPKEMLTIVDKPLIQYAVEEAVEAGIKEIIFITSDSKQSIEDHFNPNFALEEKLKYQKKEELLDLIQNIIPQNISCSYIIQHEALGLGHAILCSKEVIGNEPFAVLLADDLITIDNIEGSCLKQMIQQFDSIQSSIVGIEKIKPEDSDKYGVVGFDRNLAKIEILEEINKIIEKPQALHSPSPFGIVGRYILTPKIFSLLENISPGYNSEIQLTDAISQLLHTESVYAYQFKGVRYDCGNKLGYLKAIVTFALEHKEVGDHFKEYLKSF